MEKHEGGFNCTDTNYFWSSVIFKYVLLNYSLRLFVTNILKIISRSEIDKVFSKRKPGDKEQGRVAGEDTSTMNRKHNLY